MEKEEFKGEITWVGPFIKSKKNGSYYRIVTFKLVDYEFWLQSKVYLDRECRNYKNWEPFLAEGNILAGLMWKDKSRGLIDADSPVHLV